MRSGTGRAVGHRQFGCHRGAGRGPAAADKILAMGGMFELDRMAQILKIATLLIVAAVFVYSADYLRRRRIFKGEYFVLGLFATLGGMVLISAAT